MQSFTLRFRAGAWRRTLASAALALTGACAHAAVGLAAIAATAPDGPITLYYPSDGAARPVERGPFTLELAVDAAPKAGNGRLVVVSHGSGGNAWVHADLARALVDDGFVVAVPQHRGDSQGDDGHPGPDSWTVRPGEVVRAIDAVGRDPRFAVLLRLDKVGVYGMSAGGHTALSLAGGRWSPARFAEHCAAHLAEDFQSCVGLATRLTGSPLDGARKWLALAVIRHRFGADDRARSDGDPRIAAIVASVPAAADFDMASLAQPRVPLGLVTARRDRWLTPRFHGDRVLAACRPCERLADLAEGGHGALLSPLPPGLTGLIGDMLNDPPGFDRAATTPAVDRKITAFFGVHLAPLGAPPAAAMASARP
jgi:predicted dienelactone hydrolase